MVWMLLAVIARAEPVDRVVAVVADEIVLASDAALIRALSSADPEGLSFWERPEAAIEAALIRAAAGDLALYRPERPAVERRVTLVEGALGDEHPLRSEWNVDRGVLRTLVRRRMVVEAWLLRNVTVPPSADARFAEETAVLLEELGRRLRVRRTPMVQR